MCCIRVHELYRERKIGFGPVNQRLKNQYGTRVTRSHRIIIVIEK